MINPIITYTFRFLFLALLQVVVLNNVGLLNLFNPYLYILFILLLPFETAPFYVLLFSFLLGLTIDTFSSTDGMHAIAATFIAFIRPMVFLIITPRGGYEHQTSPNLKNMGAPWFITYAIIMVFIHHLILFNIEVFRLSEFFITLARTALSSLFTLVLIILSQYLLSNSKKR
jgi:hypothetical protein